MNTYITFGQTHVHRVNGKTFDKDCVAVMEDVGLDSFTAISEVFGQKWSREFGELEWDEKTQLLYYPRGYIHVG